MPFTLVRRTPSHVPCCAVFGAETVGPVADLARFDELSARARLSVAIYLEPDNIDCCRFSKGLMKF